MSVAARRGDTGASTRLALSSSRLRASASIMAPDGGFSFGPENVFGISILAISSCPFVGSSPRASQARCRVGERKASAYEMVLT